jgi:hypothetical protein
MCASRIEVVRDGEEALDYLFCRGDYHGPPAGSAADPGFAGSETA